MKIAKLLPVDGINVSQNLNLVSDDYDFETNLMEDVTSIWNFERMMIKNYLEYGKFRNILVAQFIPLWETLTFEEKKFCVRYFKYPANISLEEYQTYFTSEEDRANWDAMIEATTGQYIIQDSIRGRRLVAMVKEVTYKLNVTQVSQIADGTFSLIFRYAIANHPGLTLWLSNGIYAPMGIDYSSNGFAQCGGFSETLRNKLLDILQNGNY